MSNPQQTILPDIFERGLSLERGGASGRAMGLFERMADRLDEIAANTRGMSSGIMASGNMPPLKRPGKGGKTGNTASGKETTIIAELGNGGSERRREGRDSRNQSVGNLLSRGNNGRAEAAHSGPGNLSRNTSRANPDNSDEMPVGKPQPLSATANAEAREDRAAKENGNILAEALSSGLDKIKGFAGAGLNAVKQESDIKDAAGYALGSPFYGALKEIKEAMPDFGRDKMDERGERKEETKKLVGAIQNGKGRQRDEKGRFIKTDHNEARRQIAQTEAIEAQLEFASQEAKKEEKRHKELVSAVRANKRGLLDKFLGRNRGGVRIERGRRSVPDRDSRASRRRGREDWRERRDRDNGLDLHGRRRIRDGREREYNGDPGRRGERSRARWEREGFPDRDERRRRRETGYDDGFDTGRERGRERHDRRRDGGLLRRAGGGLARGAGNVAAFGGKAISGLLGALPGIGQMLAVGLAAYEGFQGWNDKELQQQAFGLKEGQEATTGQKASTAAASILDMGGLTSGLLGMFGIEFDKAGVAKGIYELGSNIGQLATSFMANAGPVLSSMWSGLSDIGAKAWEGAKNLGSAVADIAGGIWDKGASLVSGIWEGAQNLAGSIASFAGNALEKGAGMLSNLWEGYTSMIGNIWSGIADFASNALSKAGEMLSGLWKGVAELPSKIADGAMDLAKKGGEFVAEKAGAAWDGAKNLAKSAFSWFTGDDEAQAAEMPKKDVATPEKPGDASLLPSESPKAEKESSVPAKDSAQLDISPPREPMAQANAAEVTPPKSRETAQSPDKAASLPDPEIIASANTEIVNAIGLLSASETAQLEKSNEFLEQAALGLSSLEKSQKEQLNVLKMAFGFDETGLIANKLDNVASTLGGLSFSGGGGYGGSYGGSWSGGGGSASSYNPDAKIGDTIAHEESGTDGVHKIGYDSTGGTSYGKWQLASKTGSYEEWLQLLESKGGQHAQIAAELRAAGPANTGSRKGHHVDVYKKLAAENAQLFEDTQRESMLMHNYNPAMNNLKSAGLRKMIEGDKALQEMMFSTSVQHGATGAGRIFNSVYKEGMSREQLINAVYDKRGTQFGSSTPEVRAGVRNRFQRERDLIMGMGNGPPVPATATANNAAQPLKYDGASQGVRLKSDGKTVDLSTVQGVESLKLQSGVNIDKMHPEAVSRLGKMAADYEKLTGQKLEISEGYRDYAEQVRVKKKYGADAATPGKSTHGMGNTFDIAKSKIVDVENRLKAKGIDPVRFFSEHGFERSAYRAGKSREHDESWHLEATDLRTAEMAADRENEKSGKKTGAEYMSAEQRARYMAPPAAPATAGPPAQSQSLPEQTPAAPQVAEATSTSPTSIPTATVFAERAASALQAMPVRQPASVEPIREIDPAREVKTPSADNGPILKLLSDILAAIQAGNKKMSGLAGGGHSGEPPAIHTEYDDPSAQSLAADTA